MKALTEADVESLISNSTFKNPVHEERLREILFGKDRLLNLENLDMVAGGMAASEPEENEVSHRTDEEPPL